MSLWDLRKLIESNVPAWVLLIPVGAALGVYLYKRLS